MIFRSAEKKHYLQFFGKFLLSFTVPTLTVLFFDLARHRMIRILTCTKRETLKIQARTSMVTESKSNDSNNNENDEVVCTKINVTV